MNRTKTITGNAYLSEREKQNFFSKEELYLILSLYGTGVSSGKWKDYAIDNSTIFSIYRHASEMPLYKIIKIIKSKELTKSGLLNLHQDKS